MNKAHLYAMRHNGAARRLIVSLAVFVVLIFACLYTLSAAGRGNDEEARAQLDAALRKAAVTCYAVEGRYPANLEELRSRYGVVIDSTRFAVFYDAFSTNQMPNITVRMKGGAR